MRTLTISNVLCHEALELELPTGPTLITGENSSGKTSVARILGALTTHTTNPARLSAALAKTYLRSGAAEGFARLSDGATWFLPAKMEVPHGLEPETGPHMVGIVDFIGSPGASVADRTAIYESLFLPSDPEPLLTPVWKQSEQQLKTVLKIIREKGWKTAFGVYDEQKKDAGRKWCKLTGSQRYSKRAAPVWRPEDWQSDLEGLSEDDVLAAMTEAQDALRAAGVRHAVEQDRIDRGIEARDEKVPAQETVLEGLKEEVDALKAEMAPLEETGAAKRKEIADQKAVVNSISSEMADIEAAQKAPPKVAAPLRCPCCEAGLEMVAGALARFEPPDPDEEVDYTAALAELQEKFDTHEATLHELEGEFNTMSTAFRAKRDELNAKTAEYNQAFGVLREYRRQAKDAELEARESNDAERSELEISRDRADARRKAWTRNRDAQLAHENYVEYEAVAKLLGPTGARATFMQAQMDRVRAALASISERSGWKPITITDAYEVVSGGYPAVLAAENEKRKCQWAIQAALTMLNRNAHWLVLDAADLLRGRSWDGLETLVNALTAKRPDLHVVVCATETSTPDNWHAIDLNAA